MLPSYDTQYAPNLILQHGSTTYDYDFLGQLIGADYANAGISDESYTYDSNGNRITANGSTYTTSTNNELTSDGVWSYTYDDEGNRISKTNSTNRELYTWDYRNRLTKVTQQTYNAETETWTTTQTIEYTYDYNNVWIRKINGSDKTIFIPENYQTTVQIDNNTVSHHYLWTPETQDKLLADTTSSEILWSLTDHLGSIRDVVGTTTNPHLIYDAFGNLVSGTNPILFGYTGKPFDTDTQLQNNINRWYDATIGRWLSTDPIGFEGEDMNLYRYVKNKNLIFTDTTGLKSHKSKYTKEDVSNAVLLLVGMYSKPGVYTPFIGTLANISCSSNPCMVIFPILCKAKNEMLRRQILTLQYPSNQRVEKDFQDAKKFHTEISNIYNKYCA